MNPEIAVAALCSALVAEKATHLHHTLTPSAIVSATSDPLSPYRTDTVKKTKQQPDRVFAMRPEKGPGIAFNGTAYPEIEMRFLEAIGRPYIVARTQQKAKIRLVFLHGLGLDISNIGSVVPSLRTVHRISSGDTSDMVSAWMVKNHPELVFPMEIVAFDLPSAGWAPPITDSFGYQDLVDSIRNPIAALNAIDPLPTILVSRSASCAPSFLVGQEHIRGIVATGGTFLDAQVVDFNVRALRDEEAKQQRKIARWDVIDNVVRFFLEPEFARKVETAAQSDLPIISLIGSEDPETPEVARDLWANLLGPHSNPYQRSALVIPGAGHHVLRYSPPQRDPSAKVVAKRLSVEASDSDVQAFLALMRFSAYHAGVWKPQGQPTSILHP